jgi:REP element-mobilizing transposase RayT
MLKTLKNIILVDETQPLEHRIVFPNTPHHITQRGNRRNDVFFCDNDKNYYLDLLQEYTLKHKHQVERKKIALAIKCQ